MKAFSIIFLMAVYALCAIFQIGGHYIHALPVMAMGIYLFGLFSEKVAGPEAE